MALMFLFDAAYYTITTCICRDDMSDSKYGLFDVKPCDNHFLIVY